jgi:pimeloyl-ACP methyl ester carboxylesterase
MVARFLPAAERMARFGMNVSGMASRWVDVNGMRVHLYDGAGRGDLPTVVMIHGLGSAGISFAGVIAQLRPHVKRVIVPELPGHGLSTHPGDRPVTPELVLDTIAAALEQVVTEPVIVVGNSLGGAIAIDYAKHHPEQVRALVLVSPAGARLKDEEWKKLVQAFDVTGALEARRFLGRIYDRPPWFLALVAHEFPDLLKRRAVRDILEHSTQEHSAHPDDLAALRMPVLLLWGRSERLLPAEALAYFREHLPKSAVIEQPDGFAHSPQLEHPKRVADRIVAFARDAMRDDPARHR